MTSQQFLHLALGIGFLVLVVFICVALVYTIKILKDVSSVSNKVKSTTEKINEIVLEPLAIMRGVYEHVRPYIGMIQQKMDKSGDDSDDNKSKRNGKKNKK